MWTGCVFGADVTNWTHISGYKQGSLLQQEKTLHHPLFSPVTLLLFLRFSAASNLLAGPLPATLMGRNR